MLARLDEPRPLFFWLPTLWGGAALVLIGSFRAMHHDKVAKALVILGAIIGFVPSAWTLIMPIAAVALVFRTVMTPTQI